MRIAVTDYDGTLGDFDGVKPDVLEAVRHWRDAGNLFGIATGRSLPMIDREILRNDIPFDFLICCNGAVVFDEQREPLVADYIPDDIISGLVNYPALKSCMHIVFCFDKKLEAIVQTDESWLFRVGVPVERVKHSRANSATGVLQISLGFPTAEESLDTAKNMLQDFPHIQTHPNSVCMDITRNSIDKGEAIARLLKVKGWENHDVLAIGDGENDIQMIKRFQGFTVTGGRPEVKALARNVYTDVGAMLRDHM